MSTRPTSTSILSRLCSLNKTRIATTWSCSKDCGQPRRPRCATLLLLSRSAPCSSDRCPHDERNTSKRVLSRSTHAETFYSHSPRQRLTPPPPHSIMSTSLISVTHPLPRRTSSRRRALALAPSQQRLRDQLLPVRDASCCNCLHHGWPNARIFSVAFGQSMLQFKTLFIKHRCAFFCTILIVDSIHEKLYAVHNALPRTSELARQPSSRSTKLERQ